MTPGAVRIIKRTELPNGLVAMTAERTDLITPFTTFTIISTTKFVQRFDDFATENAALFRHEQLVTMSKQPRVAPVR